MASQQQARRNETRPHAFFRADQGRRGEDEDGKRGDTKKTEQMRRLHHDRHRHDAITDGVPGKASCYEAAEPFQKAECGRKCGDTAETVRPDDIGGCDRKTVKHGENSRKAEDGER
ncbi:hypothetical protein D3C72_1666750 [compost metagenome]